LSGRRFASSCACSIADFSDASSNWWVEVVADFWP
jgi:hypothetical protein